MKTRQAFKPSNKLTFQTVESERLRLFELIESESQDTILLDLKAIKVCDSAGLALLIEAKRLCKLYNKKLEIESMPESVAALATFCALDKVLS